MSDKDSTNRIQEMYDRVSNIKNVVKNPVNEKDAAISTKNIEQENITYAGFWKRFAAAFIDYSITILLSLVIGVIIGIIYIGSAEEAKIMGNIAGVITFWIYYAAFESSSKQATLGKMALGIKVTDLNGKPVGFGRATGRYVGRAISILILFIGCIMIAFTQKKQGLHDIMAGCLVINK